MPDEPVPEVGPNSCDFHVSYVDLVLRLTKTELTFLFVFAAAKWLGRPETQESR
jgi:hypothetical protein